MDEKPHTSRKILKEPSALYIFELYASSNNLYQLFGAHMSITSPGKSGMFL